MRNNITRLGFAALLIVSGCMAVLVGKPPTSYYRAQAQPAPTPAILRFQISNVGTSQVLPLAGQSYCGIVFTSVGSGVTADIEGTTDGNVWATLTQASGSGSFTPPIVNTQTNFSPLASGASALTGIRLNVTVLSSGPVSGTIVCTNSAPGVSGTITAVISGTVSTTIVGPTCANALPCVQVSSLPGPAVTNSPSGAVITQPVNTLTSGVTINQPLPDAYATPVAIATASTTLLYSGTASQYTVVWAIALQSTGTNTSDTENWEWGTGATCGTGTQTFFSSAIGFTGASGNLYSLYPADSFTGTGGQALGGIGPGFVIPLVAANICIVTTSATVALKAFGIFSSMALAP